MPQDRKSTRLNSSHLRISYAVFCLKKKHSAERWERARMAASGTEAAPISASPGTQPCGAPHRRETQSAHGVTIILFFFFLMNRDPPGFTPFPLQGPFRF